MLSGRVARAEGESSLRIGRRRAGVLSTFLRKQESQVPQKRPKKAKFLDSSKISRFFALEGAAHSHAATITTAKMESKKARKRQDRRVDGSDC
jgi:hypothetical protein